ncbi:hypothetical protein BGW36DRAFT_428212 [Talaromyces proteolyticus]|uniref:Uncharacterized protein n=1 Tax=Talaromyces proteolyticus TaxID=1131652 RepID=A0AAD4KMJ4_9EURO|nr:uncharacterized protein BGW36DRAFT_428212 [Talaromyces proteolyticus]KAH8696192.1 hypothetical protein BGW36DRAFT_428212 [Talaromyces proteolyticus]
MESQTTETPNREVEGKAKAVQRKHILASANMPGQNTLDTTCTNKDQSDKRVERFFKWALNVAVLAAAIVFGIWAPLSYNITLDGNSSNDASSSSMLSAVLAASSQASIAASTQSAILEDMSGRMGAIGQLWLVDFCATQTTISACQQFNSEINVPSLVSKLASTTATQSSTASSSPSTTNTPSNGHTVSTHISVPAILGIVFVALVAVGWLIGVYVLLSRRRQIRGEVET